MTVIDLSTDGAPDPEDTLKLAELFAEIARVMNHRTRHHGALKYPAEADRLIRELSSAAARLPQLLGQIGAWLLQEQEAGRIEVGHHRGGPLLAVNLVRLRLDAASALATQMQETLDLAATVTSDLAAREDGTDDDH